MKIRTVISITIGLGVFCALVYGIALTALYCDQVFTGEVPTVCVMTRQGFAGLGGSIINMLGILLLFAIPISCALLYSLYGWPRKLGAAPTSGDKQR